MMPTWYWVGRIVLCAVILVMLSACNQETRIQRAAKDKAACERIGGNAVVVDASLGLYVRCEMEKK